MEVKRIWKFGGASLKDADSIRNMRDIMAENKNNNVLVVVSAMGKTTNMLESILDDFRTHDGNLGIEHLTPLMQYHEDIILDLFQQDTEHPIFEKVSELFLDLYERLQETGFGYDYHYDQTICYGELLSSTIIAAFLNESSIPTRWLDARDYVITDFQFRSASPDWDETRLRISRLEDEHINGITCLTQGFIGRASDGKSTSTLGREGSDFTAAIFGYCLDAEEVTIWKDVDGLRNADPKRFEKTEKLEKISYSEAIELSFYGASIIHPKTLKPLQNKNIPLKVQSFICKDSTPSVIMKYEEPIAYPPSFIVKDQQCLISIAPRDFSFMNESNLHKLFGIFGQLDIHANMIQTSALSLSICVDEDQIKISSLTQALQKDYKIRFNEGLQLFTIRHYRQGIEEDFVKDRKVLLKQASRSTLQIVLG